MTNKNLTIQSNDLNAEYYSFYIEDIDKIWLDEYHVLSRQSKRHKWNIVKAYSRLNSRYIFNYQMIKLKEEEVFLHDGIKRMLIDTVLIPSIKIGKWSER